MATESLRLGLSLLLNPSFPKKQKQEPQQEQQQKLSKPVPPSKQLVFHISHLPKWMQLDPYIVHWYRPQLDSFEECFWSLFYLHNESINTWSHLLPGAYFVALLLMVEYWVSHLPFNVTLADVLAIQTYIAGTAGCLIFSAVFHATNAHSKEVATVFLKLDYLGIIMTISTTCTSMTYFGLYDSPFLQTTYISLTVFCAALVFWVTLDPRMDGVYAGHWRAAVFILLAASGLAPLCHVSLLEGVAGLEKFPLETLCVTCISYAVGTMVYVSRFPEKFWPQRFDLLGASHQVFHILVAFGQIVHLYGLRDSLIRCYLDNMLGNSVPGA
ncbi:HlyIII-domain-containing protein [Aspergillus steynii IBT 23096]|uniref:HlyIII-domain-containing protein n=1 Tax=Aspergillus steynii IBT 23096 TaxID=1392250 RepID=A0A2I2GH89_9EURO|nr:HlyIII-domain-containing protein [Aspergillus steynii IBT 23096]PLB52249.1 HlyIII-domain-containing protein [Aspergillus steynii IBT 23096]